MLEHVWQQVMNHKALLAALSLGFTALLVVASLIGLPWFVARLPADYFCRAASQRPKRRGPLQVAARVGKNIIGAALIVLGVLMLLLPGQGVVTILLALTLLDFPGKKRVERWLLRREPLRRGLNWLRKRAHKPPFEWEHAT
jgi:hypothetical protein